MKGNALDGPNEFQAEDPPSQYREMQGQEKGTWPFPLENSWSIMRFFSKEALVEKMEQLSTRQVRKVPSLHIKEHPALSVLGLDAVPISISHWLLSFSSQARTLSPLGVISTH